MAPGRDETVATGASARARRASAAEGPPPEPGDRAATRAAGCTRIVSERRATSISYVRRLPLALARWCASGGRG